MLCKFCNMSSCDCAERMTCEKAGEVSHSSCGTLLCGCPKFRGACTGLCKEVKDINRAKWPETEQARVNACTVYEVEELEACL